ncbi:undecaprenyl-phosphate glucose phosphotransferase [Halomonas sp. McH1-25]|uniref:undecaprenyl-phosphate glucose phosphotransferase n=1 Tax=unclassified Halomonas TaxID=2609666 RepID=UPI001EF6F475|nr:MULTISPECIES: undecaprenyl-phosphate glucose phosphotransferase [unclassified Halomonas]MCG7601026.1 undecaprenyl-phosphate glucose phosphotransferase [Halomonas sp. McH1-25]MCP1342117.1 undecaprenyl-phosphate glucose phosphotransferase [Halomonas sp. FL8]MCP1360594.1 undecaprenyl-phosphate glucose phosphotransferase [Halomonas sp. BBD45]
MSEKKFTHGLLQRHSSHLGIAQRILDATIIFGGIFVFGLHLPDAIGLEWLLVYGLAAWFFYQVGASAGNFYGSWRIHSLGHELTAVGLLWVVVFGAVLALALLVFKDTAHAYYLLVPWGIAVGGSILLYRSLLRVLLHRLRELGFNTRNVAIVGCGEVADKLVASFNDAPWMGFNVVGQFALRVAQPSDNPPKGLEQMSDVEKVIDIARNHQLDRIYITWGLHRQAEIRQLIEALADTTVSLYIVPDLLVADMIYSRIEPINDTLTVSVYDTPAHGPSGSLKRIEDIVLGSLIIAMIALPMLIIAIGIKMTSPGPILFKQNRYGLDGRPIEVYKFRSMCVMENDDKIVQATRNDTRITPFGSFLRRTSLDELPQFINVLQGRMSIVGPRPHAVAHNEEYRGQIRGYMLRHKMKPGITGWAQINGWRGETDTLEKMEKRIEFDHAYIRHWSLGFDLKIIFLTMFKGFMDDNAY